MRSQYLLFYYLLFFISHLAKGQTPDTLYRQRSYFSFTYDNDFFNATDRYYTQGIRLELGHSFVKKSPVSNALLSFKNKAFQQYGVAIEQDCFTPPSISRDTIQTGERPFSGLLYLSHFQNSTQSAKHQKIITQFDIGIIGPCAQCKEMQMGIHRWLANITPRGWQFQLANDLILNYDFQFEKGLWLRKHLELLGYTNIRIGTLYDDLAIGAAARIGFFKPYFKPHKQVNGNKFYIHGVVSGNIKSVGYDATLQGGLFTRNNIYSLPASQIERIIASGAVGIIITYQKVNIEFTRMFISPDYKNGLSHGWGHIKIGLDF